MSFSFLACLSMSCPFLSCPILFYSVCILLRSIPILCLLGLTGATTIKVIMRPYTNYVLPSPARFLSIPCLLPSSVLSFSLMSCDVTFRCPSQSCILDSPGTLQSYSDLVLVVLFELSRFELSFTFRSIPTVSFSVLFCHAKFSFPDIPTVSVKCRLISCSPVPIPSC